MLAKQRQDKIYSMLKADGAVTVAKLVKTFDVSIETIRKDLLLMEQHGFLKRVHGGAVKTGEMASFETLNTRSEENVELKYELCQKAIAYIEENDIIAVDSGSTAAAFARLLKDNFKSLTVITHSRDVFEILCDSEGIDVILCAGHYLKGENAFYGDIAIESYRQLHAQKAFIFPSAISLKYGICDFQKELFSVQKQIVGSASKIFILADHSKFEKTGLLRLCDMREDYTFITDSNLSQELKAMYNNNGIEVIL